MTPPLVRRCASLRAVLATGGASACLALAGMAQAQSGQSATPPAAQTPSTGASSQSSSSQSTSSKSTSAPKSPPKPAPKPAPQDEDDEDDAPPTVTVKAKHLPGAVIGDIKPELSLSPVDIQSYGVSTVAELINELAPQTRSDRGRGGETPVILLNGHRISAFNEIRDIPTEAILRVDILPEEVSLKYGYTADQRVVNIVLRRRFHATAYEGTGGGATEGGEVQGQAEGDMFHLRGDNRLNIDLRYTGSSAISDASRHVIENDTGTPYDLRGNVTSPTAGGSIADLSALAGQPVTVAGVPASAASGPAALAAFLPGANTPNLTDVSHDRTVSPSSQALTLNAVQALPGPFGTNVTFNGTAGWTQTEALNGLPGVTLTVPAGDPFSPFAEPVDVQRYVSAFGPLHQEVDGWTGHLGMTANKDTNDWRFNFTTAYDHADSLTLTDTGLSAAALQLLLNGDSPGFNPFGPLPNSGLARLSENKARSISDSVNVQFVASGSLFDLPAGAFFTTLKIGDTFSNFDSHTESLGLAQSSDLDRNDFNLQGNFDLPLLDPAHTDVLKFLGDLSLNGNAAIDELSDFGLLTTLGYGMNWTPITGLNLIVSQTHDQAAPTEQQLAGPEILTPGQRVLDYATGQTVLVTTLSGGNPALVADHRVVTKVGLT